MNEICEMLLLFSLCQRLKHIRQMAAQYAFIPRLAIFLREKCTKVEKRIITT